MGDPEEPTTAAVGPVKERNLGRRLVLVVAAIVVLVLSWWIGGAVLPRWWAQRISGVIDGRLLFGNLFGFCVGAIFTLLPLLVLWTGWKFRGGWKRLAAFIVAALVVATPNLLTLGIVLGSGNAAHAAERTLDVDGPGFRGGSTFGAVFAIFAFLAVSWLARSRRKNKRRASDLKQELDAQSGN